MTTKSRVAYDEFKAANEGDYRRCSAYRWQTKVDQRLQHRSQPATLTSSTLLGGKTQVTAPTHKQGVQGPP
jgi:hypothetical protein